MKPDLEPLHLLYFASLAERLGCEQERLPLAGKTSAAQLRQRLIDRGACWQALADTNIKIAVNQTLASADTSIQPGDEVAFFPPVTGG